ncbi:MAG: transglutaminase family protein, partial [Candidatus Zophobacter franzmannii]|nr:transglutaminase family protein [Candidatus Zophobacter franzmannii]
MQYRVRHHTRFRYSAPVSESVMKLRLQPVDQRTQRCLDFQVQLEPSAQLHNYLDHLSNRIHLFDIPTHHRQLDLRVESMVTIDPLPPLPDCLALDEWDLLDAAVHAEDHWEFLMPTPLTQPTSLLDQLAEELGLDRSQDPLSVVHKINAGIYRVFEYVPESTGVDSPIDDALAQRQGVCQDFTHIMLALVRRLGIPCRYVSGYLFHRTESGDRSAVDAMHAWVEAYLPTLGWVGFDPTNNMPARERHIRVAVGRDYVDVAPTRGVFKGNAESELSVAVQVFEIDASPPLEPLHKVVAFTPQTAA